MPTLTTPHPQMAELNAAGGMPVFGYYEVEVWEVDGDAQPTNLVVRKLTFAPEVTLSVDDGLEAGREYALIVRFIGSSDAGLKISDKITMPDFVTVS